MLRNVYSIRDSKAEIFNQPWQALTHGEAERNFTQLVHDEKSQIHSFPDDYDLYYLGRWDDLSGKHEMLDTPQHIIKAVQIKNR